MTYDSVPLEAGKRFRFPAPVGYVELHYGQISSSANRAGSRPCRDVDGTEEGEW
jgi:hypothetical protein